MGVHYFDNNVYLLQFQEYNPQMISNNGAMNVTSTVLYFRVLLMASLLL
jgi:hypothetical protein